MDLKRTPKHRWLQQKILDLIETNGLKPGDPIPSEREISKSFETSIETTRKSLLTLAHEGHIIRLQGKGSFVAPKPKRHRILVVYNEGYLFHHRVVHREIDAVSFLVGLMHEAQNHAEYFVDLINRETLMKQMDDLEVRYPGVRGCLFFRQPEHFAVLRPRLEAKGLSCLFYGSDTFRHGLAGANAHYYQEKAIIHSELEHLISRGYRRIGLLTEARPETPVNQNRRELARAFFSDRSIEFPEERDLREDGSGSAIHRISAVDALAGCSDKLALPFMQLALRRGVRIPKDLAIVGIDDNPLAEVCFPSLTTVRIPVQDDAAVCMEQLVSLIERARPSYQGWSDIRLIAREST